MATHTGPSTASWCSNASTTCTREANQARQARLAERNRRTTTEAGHAPATAGSPAADLLARTRNPIRRLSHPSAPKEAAVTSQSTPAVETAGLAKTFSTTRAVDGVDLTVPAGSVYGILAPTAPARPPPSASWPPCCVPTPGQRGCSATTS
jgi:hypothetical protein